MVAQGGWMLSDPVVVKEANGSLTAYAVDAAGALYRRTHSTWFQIGTGSTTDYTVIRNGANNDVVARFPDNSVRTARVTNGTLGPWRAIGTDTAGKPAAVVHANGDLQVFTRRPDGKIHTQREVAGAFPGAWQALGDFVAAGSPAAVIRDGGLLELAARSTDGLVYQASQLAPAGGFGQWRVEYFEEAATDPAGAVLLDSSPIFTWRSPQGVIVTVHAPAAAQKTVFLGTSAL